MTNDVTTRQAGPAQYDDPQDEIGRNPSQAAPMQAVIASRIGRRDLLQGLLSSAAAAGLVGLLPPGASEAQAQARSAGGLTFKELPKAATDRHAVAEGYDARVLIRWGDPVVAGAPKFDPNGLTAEAQEKQFGYNCDLVEFFPLPIGSKSPTHGLLAVNHEYTNTDLMWPGLNRSNLLEKVTRDMVEVELAAHGVSVIEVVKRGNAWSVVPGSRYARRVSLRSTEIAVSGPAAGHDRLKTSADPTGRKVIGTINNCAGGTTAWGTLLTAEENFHQYFAGAVPAGHREEANYKRVGVTGRPVYGWWGKHVARFDVGKEPNEPNRFGWVVEIDPYDPQAAPVKRTALGRFKHENATTLVNKDGRVVVYSGDDERFEYIYKFVSAGRFNPNDRAANRNLLDEGTLYVARFSDNGSLTWLPLRHGFGPLIAANGFNSQADVVIEARRAGDLLGATPMDRPEDVEANPVTGTVYVMLTNNSRRTPADGKVERERVNAANPRPRNNFGHVLAMIPPGGRGANADHAAEEFTWTIPILCGSDDPSTGAKYAPGTSVNAQFAAPDNVAFDSRGRMWITTDQGTAWQKLSKAADGVFAMEVEGPQAYVAKRFFSVPIGAEMCGPCFTSDDRTLFVAVQHPAADGIAFSTFDAPATRWPDFRPDTPPRPSVVAITKRDGGTIGG